MSSGHFRAMAKTENGICLLLDIDHILEEGEQLTQRVLPTETADAD